MTVVAGTWQTVHTLLLLFLLPFIYIALQLSTHISLNPCNIVKKALSSPFTCSGNWARRSHGFEEGAGTDPVPTLCLGLFPVTILLSKNKINYKWDLLEMYVSLNTPQSKNILRLDEMEKVPMPNPSRELGLIGLRHTQCSGVQLCLLDGVERVGLGREQPLVVPSVPGPGEPPLRSLQADIFFIFVSYVLVCTVGA